MNISIPDKMYTTKSRWKLYIGIGGMIIVLLTMIYVYYLTQRLKEGELYSALVLGQAYEFIKKNEPDLQADLTFQNEIIIGIKHIPIVVTDLNDKVVYGKNFGESNDQDNKYLQREVNKMKQRGINPITIDVMKVYWKNSRWYTMLTYFPLIQGIMLVAFIGLGYFGFSEARKREQNQVWVGMAKETAHQLGTPISAIMGWLEHLKEMPSEEAYHQEIISELNKDVQRLQLIADRFSKIGSAPDLNRINLLEELDRCRHYMEKRAPRKVVFSFPELNGKEHFAKINPPLFDWVIENLVRNALDAMDGVGTISAKVYDEDEEIIIDITDTGKGIAQAKFKTVFEPGYTTKSRGWGLGLSLAKRIIEFYHQGKIYVKSSQLNEGTTFSIRLPRAN